MPSVFSGQFVLFSGERDVGRSEPTRVLLESRPGVVEAIEKSEIAKSPAGASMRQWLKGHKAHCSDPVRRLQRALGECL